MQSCEESGKVVMLDKAVVILWSVLMGCVSGS